MRRYPALVLLFATLLFPDGRTATADEEKAPWLAAVSSGEDRAMLGGLLSADEGVRKSAVKCWHEERNAFVESNRGPGFPPGPRDEMDPDKPGDAYEARKVRITSGFLIALEKGDAPTRAAACRSIADLAPAFSNARDALGKAIDDEAGLVRATAIGALAQLRPFEGGRRVVEHVPRMVDHLLDDDDEARRAAIRAVGYLMEADEHPVELVQTALERLGRSTAARDEKVRAHAYAAITRLAPERPWTATILRRGLDDPVWQVRRTAAHCHTTVARRHGEEGIVASVPRLRELLADGEADVRWAAARALWEITEDPAGLLPAHREALSCLENVELATACRVLCRIGPDALAAAPALVAVVGKVPHWRHMTTGEEPLDALRSIGPRLADVRSALLERLGRPASEERQAALRALDAVHAAPADLAAFLLAHLEKEEDPDVRTVAIGVLCARAPEHPRCLALVHAQLSDRTSPEHRIRGVHGAATLRARGGALVPLLVRVLAEQPKGWNRRTVIEALGWIGTPEAVGVLVKHLDIERDAELAWGALARAGTAASHALDAVLERHAAAPGPAARVLAAMGAGAAPAKAAIEKLLASAQGRHAVQLAEALRGAGAPPAPCVQALEGALSHQQEAVRAAAAEALGGWGKAAAKALPALRRLRDASDLFDDDGIAAAVAAFRVGGDVEPTLKRCLEVVRCSSPPDTQAIRGLGLLGPTAVEAVPELEAAALRWRTAFWKWDPAERTAASIEALGRIGAGARDALPVIRSLGRNRQFTEVAEEAIRRIEAAR